MKWKNNQHSYPLGGGLFPFLFFGGGPGVGLPSTGGGGCGGGGPTHNCYKKDENYI